MKKEEHEREMRMSEQIIEAPLTPLRRPPPAPPWNSEENFLSDVNSNANLVKSHPCSCQLSSRSQTPLTPAPSPPPPVLSPAEQKWNLLKGLLLCQITSLLICGTAVFSTLLVSHGVDIPTLQSFGNYCLLTVVYTVSFLCVTPNHVVRRTFHERWWKYLLLALFDVEGNYMMVKAYQYTSITSVQLLDSVTIPVVLVLSWMILKYRFQLVHIGGVAVAMLGMGIMIYADVKREATGGKNGTEFVDWDSNASEMLNSSDSSNSTSHLKWVGDILAILGATCYGVSNVGQEYFVNNAGQHEFLAAIGFFGALVNGVQFALLEWREATTIVATASPRVILYIVGFNLCLFAIYSIVPKTLQLTSAAVFNISILTSDFYTFLFGLFLFLLPLDPIYFLAYFLVIVGIIVYSYRAVPNQ